MVLVGVEEVRLELLVVIPYDHASGHRDTVTKTLDLGVLLPVLRA